MALLQALVSSVLETDRRVAISCLAILVLVLRFVHGRFVHALAGVPGPALASFTSLWLAYHAYVGDQASVFRRLHEKHGPVIRVGPREIDIAAADCLPRIYGDRGGFPKAACYATFDIDGHATIFSTLTLAARAQRARAVAPLFSTAALQRDARPLLDATVQRLVRRLRREADTSRRENKNENENENENEDKNRTPVNLINVTRAFAVDAVSAYLFQKPYGGLEERTAKLSVTPFVDAFVHEGAFFHVPARLARLCRALSASLRPDAEADASFEAVERYTAALVREADTAGGSYPARLLATGVGRAQAQIECKDLIFAGSDSTGMSLAMILWNLCRNPEIYAKLRAEVLSKPPNTDAQSLPLLNGVIRESLRLGNVTPIRLPRRVPAPGWTYRSHFFPAGTVVGASAYELHRDPRVYRDPLEWRPERWLPHHHHHHSSSEEMAANWFAFGKGSRSCIAQNLALFELFLATEAVVREDVLRGARAVQSEIRVCEWFNGKPVGGGVEVVWE